MSADLIPHHVNTKLPKGWMFDDLFFDEVYTKIDRLIRLGMTDIQIAVSVGCSDKTVTRHRARDGKRPVRSYDRNPIPGGNSRIRISSTDIEDLILTQQVSNNWLRTHYGVSYERARSIREGLAA